MTRQADLLRQKVRQTKASLAQRRREAARPSMAPSAAPQRSAKNVVGERRALVENLSRQVSAVELSPTPQLEPVQFT